MNIPELNLPRVVVIGGGFAGLSFCKNIDSSLFQTVLIDKQNYHCFLPLLYQVASAGLEPDSIAYPIRKIFKEKKHFHFRVATVNNVNLPDKLIETDKGSLSFDYIVFATGSQTNFFGNKTIENYSVGMKSLKEALDLRSMVLQNFEEALLAETVEERQALMNFVIVGGGPTGTELAGAFAELKNHVLPKDFPDLDIRSMNIHLIEAAPRVLSAMSTSSSKYAKQYLEDLGVRVWEDTLVTGYNGSEVKTKSGKTILSKSLIWAAGVKGAMVDGIPPSHIVQGNRLKVNENSQFEEVDFAFAIGDIAGMKTEKYPKGHPMMAQPGIQQGKLLAKNFSRMIKSQKMLPFRYHDKGSMATVGRNKAVVDLPKSNFKGMLAWLVWMFIHLMALVGFRNKVVTFFNWSYAYINYDRGTRLIVRKFQRKE